MKPVFMVFTLLLFQINFIFSEDEETQVQDVLLGYKTAILNDEGRNAYSFIDRKTRSYYSWLKDSSLRMPKGDFERLGITDRLQIVIMRHRIPAADLMEMSGEDLFVHAVNNGWVGKNGVSRMGIGKIRIDDNFATGEVTIDDNPAGLFFHFYKEDEKWRIDITEMTKWGEMALNKSQKNSEMSVNDYIIKLTETVSKRPVNRESIFSPIVADESSE